MHRNTEYLSCSWILNGSWHTIWERSSSELHSCIPSISSIWFRNPKHIMTSHRPISNMKMEMQSLQRKWRLQPVPTAQYTYQQLTTVTTCPPWIPLGCSCLIPPQPGPKEGWKYCCCPTRRVALPWLETCFSKVVTTPSTGMNHWMASIPHCMELSLDGTSQLI